MNKTDTAKIYKKHGYTRLHIAAENGDIETVKTELKNHPEDINKVTRNDENHTPIMLAAMGGHTATVRLLIENGADVLAENDNRQTAYSLGRTKNNPELNALLESATAQQKAEQYHDPIYQELAPFVAIHAVIKDYLEKHGQVNVYNRLIAEAKKHQPEIMRAYLKEKRIHNLV